MTRLVELSKTQNEPRQLQPSEESDNESKITAPWQIWSVKE